MDLAQKSAKIGKRLVTSRFYDYSFRHCDFPERRHDLKILFLPTSHASKVAFVPMQRWRTLLAGRKPTLFPSDKLEQILVPFCATSFLSTSIGVIMCN